MSLQTTFKCKIFYYVVNNYAHLMAISHSAKKLADSPANTKKFSISSKGKRLIIPLIVYKTNQMMFFRECSLGRAL